jgi:hypothetical protein
MQFARLRFLSLLLILPNLFFSACVKKNLAEEIEGKWIATTETLEDGYSEDTVRITLTFLESGLVEIFSEYEADKPMKQLAKLEQNKLIMISSGDSADIFLDKNILMLVYKNEIDTFERLK